ncbi:F-box protein PP2-B11 [Sesamum angolense]|uniref:F-box protein PP2-B11 n=1 Tax=Sesamum angolense TaxID=2727404 RepID=A0AAE1W747_9LAMI|nr:F-box protein PP2-B11 [Sesamum angolense]
MLSKNSEYAAYLVFWVERMDGLRSSNTVIRFRKGQSKIGTSNERFESREGGKVGKMRGDGWMEIEVGKFYNGDGDNGEVEAWFTQINSPIGLSGLVVEGIEFRPL